MAAPKFYTAADALAPMPGVQWAIDKILPVASVGVMFGAPGSKKTWACLDLAICTALGKAWLDTFPTVQGAVLLIDEESGPRRLLQRLGDVIRGHLADTSLPIFATSLHGFNLWGGAGKQAARELEDAIRVTQARLVVIDALADIMLGGDENLVRDTQPVFQRLRSISEATGAAILVIHHAGKNGGYRGSSAISGAIDLLLEVSSKTGSLGVEFETTKCRDGEPIKFSGECHWQPNQFWMTGGLKTAAQGASTYKYSKGQKAVVAFLLKQTNCTGTSQEIETATQYVAGTVRNMVSDLVRAGILKRIDSGGPGTPGIYEVDPLGLASNPP